MIAFACSLGSYRKKLALARISMETLEDRAAPATLSYNAGTFTCSYHAEFDEANSLSISYVFPIGGNPQLSFQDAPDITINCDVPPFAGGNQLGQSATLDLFANQVVKVNVFVYDLDDSVWMRTNIPLFAFGGTGRDYLSGGSGNDQLTGGDNGDWLYGNVGVDNLTGEGGNDELWGGDDPDVCDGGAGADLIHGGGGGDHLIGGSQNDRIWGDDQNDTLAGEAGNDSLQGGQGDDTLMGGLDDDTVQGNAGVDELWGQDGADLFIWDIFTEKKDYINPPDTESAES